MYVFLTELARLFRGEADDFDFQRVFDTVFAAEHGVDGVEGGGVEVAFAALGADLGLQVLHDVEATVQPVVLGHFFLGGLTVAEFTAHGAQSLA